MDQYGDRESPLLALDLSVEGDIDLETSRFGEAGTALKRAIAIAEADPDHSEVVLAIALTYYSELLINQQQPALAIPVARRAQRLFAQSDLRDKTILAETTVALAEALAESDTDPRMARGMLADACQTYSRAKFTKKTEQILSWFNRVLRPSGVPAATSCEDISSRHRAP